MLLIHCPYCEQDLPELEFAYAGEAHIARPAASFYKRVFVTQRIYPLLDEPLPLSVAVEP